MNKPNIERNDMDTTEHIDVIWDFPGTVQFQGTTYQASHVALPKRGDIYWEGSRVVQAFSDHTTRRDVAQLILKPITVEYFKSSPINYDKTYIRVVGGKIAELHGAYTMATIGAGFGYNQAYVPCTADEYETAKLKPEVKYYRHGARGLDGFMTRDGGIVADMRDRKVSFDPVAKGQPLRCQDCLDNPITKQEWEEIQDPVVAEPVEFGLSAPLDDQDVALLCLEINHLRSRLQALEER